MTMIPSSSDEEDFICNPSSRSIAIPTANATNTIVVVVAVASLVVDFEVGRDGPNPRTSGEKDEDEREVDRVRRRAVAAVPDDKMPLAAVARVFNIFVCRVPANSRGVEREREETLSFEIDESPRSHIFRDSFSLVSSRLFLICSRYVKKKCVTQQQAIIGKRRNSRELLSRTEQKK